MSGVPTDGEYLEAMCEMGHEVACDPGPSWFEVIPWTWVGAALVFGVVWVFCGWARVTWRAWRAGAPR